MRIEVTEEELIYIVAAIGRVHEPPNTELYERLRDNLLPGEQHRADRLIDVIRFSNTPWLSNNSTFIGRDL